MASVHKNTELDFRGSAQLHDRLHRGARGTGGVDHVVRQHNSLVLDAEADAAALDLGDFADARQVVAVQRDIQLADRNLRPFDRLNMLCQSPGKRHAAGADTDQTDILQSVILFDNLMCDALERSVDVIA